MGTEREKALERAFTMAALLFDDTKRDNIIKAIKSDTKNKIDKKADVKALVLAAGLGVSVKRAEWLANYLKEYDPSLLDAEAGW